MPSHDSTVFGISFPAGASVWFLFLWYTLYPSTYFFTFFVTPGHQKFLVTNFVIFHCPLCPPTGMSWCNWITSALNFLFLGTYTFLSLNISPSSSLYSSSLSIFTPAHFISFTAFTTSSSFASDFFIFSNKSIPSMITSATYVALTSSHSFFINTLSLLSFSTPFCQSGHLLRLLAFPILDPGTCSSIKSNLDRYKAHCAYL